MAAAPGAQLDATLQAIQLQLAALAALPAQIAALQAQIAALVNVPAIAGQVVQTAQAVLAAQRLNRHDRDAEPYAMVPLNDGAAPANWPVPPAAGFDRGALMRGPVALVDLLLADYGLAHGALAGPPLVRRNALARRIGTTQG